VWREEERVIKILLIPSGARKWRKEIFKTNGLISINKYFTKQ
jgi:hypothetical protein